MAAAPAYRFAYEIRLPREVRYPGEVSPGWIATGPDETLYVGEPRNRCVYRFTPQGRLLGSFGAANVKEGGAARIFTPGYMAFAPNGTLFISAPQRVERRDAKGGFLSIFYDWKWDKIGKAPGQFGGVGGIAFGPGGDVYLCDSGNGRVQVFGIDGRFRRYLGTSPEVTGRAGKGGFESPTGIVVDKEGSVYVADSASHWVQKFDRRGRFLFQWGGERLFSREKGGLCGPYGLALGPGGTLFVGDAGNDRVQVFDRRGRYLCHFSAPQSVPRRAIGHASVALGRDGRVYATDVGHQSVSVFEPAQQGVVGASTRR